MTNTSPKGQRVPAPPAEVVAAAAARPGPTGRAGAEPVPVLLPCRLPLPPPCASENRGWATELRSLPNSNILDTTTRERLSNRILTEREREKRAHARGVYLESRFRVIAGETGCQEA